MKKKAAIAATAIVVYCIAFALMVKTVVVGAPTVALIPVVTIAWLFGLWPGVLAGIIFFPVNALMLTAFGLGMSQMLGGGGIAGTPCMIIVAAIVGRMHDLSVRLSIELQERKKIEQELKHHRDNLDMLVREKTAELQTINAALHNEIEQRKLMEKELATLATAVEQANDTIMIFDTNGVITYINPAGEAQTGYSCHELAGKSLAAFNRNATQKNLFRQALETISKGCIWNGHMQETNKQGVTHDFVVAISPIRSPSGEITSFVSIARDATKELAMEKRLRQAEKMEALGALAGGVAHDLNNTLGAIVGYPDLLLKDLPQDSQIRKPLVAIKQSGERAAAIVQDLLTLARRGVQIAEVVNLNTIVKKYLESREYAKLQEYHPGAATKTNLAGDLLSMIGSPVHLLKTLMNLVANAAEALPEGNGTVTISTENRYIDRQIKGYDSYQEGDYAVLCVEDNGIGISDEDLPKIFEPFYTKKVMGRSGTGLGLAIAWGTVKDHQGYIDVHSTEGRGTSFTLYFPATRQEPEGVAKPVPIEQYAGHGEKILVVDDDKAQREIATLLLQQLNYAVVTVSSGEEAVAYMKTHTADLIILDMIMDPGIDGLDTYKQILETNPGQKAIIASGFSETNRVREAQKLGTGMYINKPYTLEKIGKAIQSELSKGRSGQSLFTGTGK